MNGIFAEYCKQQNCKNFTVNFEENTCHLLSHCNEGKPTVEKSLSGSGQAIAAISCGLGCGTKIIELSLQCGISKFECIIENIYGVKPDPPCSFCPTTEIPAECKPCICEILCFLLPSLCNLCKCSQDIFISAPNVVPCITRNITKDHDIVGGTLCALYNYKTQAKTISLPSSCKTAGFCSELSELSEPLLFKGATCNCVFENLATTILRGISEATLSKDNISSNRNLIPLAMEILANLPQNGCNSAICENMLVKQLAQFTDYCECGFSISPTLNSCPAKDPENSMEDSLICASKKIPFNGCKSTVNKLLCSHFGNTSVECKNSDCATKTLPTLFNCMTESAGNVPLAINCTFESLNTDNCVLEICDVACNILTSYHIVIPLQLLPNVCLSRKICENIL